MSPGRCCGGGENLKCTFPFSITTTPNPSLPLFVNCFIYHWPGLAFSSFGSCKELLPCVPHMSLKYPRVELSGGVRPGCAVEVVQLAIGKLGSAVPSVCAYIYIQNKKRAHRRREKDDTSTIME